MAERIISADSHVDISRDRVLANLPGQYHEAYKAERHDADAKDDGGQAAEAAEEQAGPGEREHHRPDADASTRGRPRAARVRTTRTSA